MPRPGQPIGKAALAALAAVALAAPLVAAPADTVRERIAGYRTLGAAFKAVNDQLRAGTGEAVVIQRSARTISDTARHQYRWFPAGTGARPGLKTGARSDIWSRPADFRRAQDGFAQKARAFEQVAATRNTEVIRAAARDLGGACKGCHDDFRNKLD